MAKEYFACRYRRKGVERFLIWYSNDTDGVLVDEHHRVPSFATIAALEAHLLAREGEAIVPEEPVLHDLDFVEARCRAEGPLGIDCAAFLSAWNLFTDIARSVGDAGARYLALDAEPNAAYEKLFYGNNLPAITPPGEHHEPAWSDADRENIRRLLLLGFALFEATTYSHEQVAPEGDAGFSPGGGRPA